MSRFAFFLALFSLACAESKPADTADTADTAVDMDTACDAQWWYPDADGDGAGCSEPGYGLRACVAPVDGWTTTGGDYGDCGVQ